MLATDMTPRGMIEAALSETLRGHTSYWRECPRPQWGGLTADQLMDMGCYATVAYAVAELIEQRNRDLRESTAPWFDRMLF